MKNNVKQFDEIYKERIINIMKNGRYLRFSLVVILGITCLKVLGNPDSNESFVVIKETITNLQKNGKEVSYKEFFDSPFEKHMNSEDPFAEGSFIYDMFHDKKFHHFSLRMIMKYMKNNPVSLTKQQEIFNFLLSNMTLKNPEWMQIEAMFMLTSFYDKKYYNEQSRKIIKDLLLKYGCKRYALFLIDRAGIYNDPEIIAFLKKEAENYRLWSRSNKTPWLALLILARNGDKDSLKKIIELASIPNKEERSFQVQLMPIQLAYVQQPEIVELLRGFLISKESYFKGEDVVPRYADLSHAAARALSNMIEGYPKINYWGYTEKIRRGCIDWFDNHKKYKFNNDAKLLFY